jgi:hypothetical protein
MPLGIPTYKGEISWRRADRALAHSRLGQADEAGRRRDEADRWLTGVDRQLAEEPFGFPPKRHPADWLIVQVLRRELDRVLAGPPEKAGTP